MKPSETRDESIHTENRSLRYALRVQIGALCIALITVGAFIAIPLPGSPVPIVLQNMFVVFTGLVLSPLWAGLTILIYLLLGALGLPVFAGAAGGLAHFAGPTGGFLLGFLPAAWITSIVMRLGRVDTAPHTAGFVRRLLAVSAGFIVIYVVGVPRLAAVAGLSIPGTLWIGFVPFLPGDVIKAAVLLILLRTLPASLWRSWT